MAIMAEDGTLVTLQTTDLMNYLSSVEGDTLIDMLDGTECLGHQAATFVLTDANGLAPHIEYTTWSGLVRGKDEQYYFDASDAVGDFISKMIRKQDAQGGKPLTVYELRTALDAYTDEIIYDEGWEAAL